MKEQIEKKIGMTIEEHFKRLHDKLAQETAETEEPSGLESLTIEELEFLADYVKSAA